MTRAWYPGIGDRGNPRPGMTSYCGGLCCPPDIVEPCNCKDCIRCGAKRDPEMEWGGR